MDGVVTFLVVIVGWVFSLTLHEFAHAFVAYKGGDWTVREKGYLTFNPLKYTHPVYSIALPLLFLVLGGIGLPGGAVYIQTSLLRSKRWETAVSLAGPFSNLLLAITLGILLRVMPISFGGIWPGLAFLALLQVTAFLFNLLPSHPLTAMARCARTLIGTCVKAWTGLDRSRCSLSCSRSGISRW